MAKTNNTGLFKLLANKTILKNAYNPGVKTAEGRKIKTSFLVWEESCGFQSG
jgi:hypothetical protein